jgi:HK97 family phage major capsid protein
MLKALIEKRNEKVAEMQSILDKAKEEKRAMTEEEMEQFNALENEISNLDATIEAEKRASNYTITDDNTENNVNGEEKRAESEERAFANYIKRQCGIHVEERTGEQNQNLDMTNNGAVIPTTIANRVITKVQELAPILAKSTRFNVKGTLKVPVWGKANTNHDITVDYQAEFTDITADSGKFTSVDLSGYLAGALTLVGKSVINNSQVNVADFVINEMAKKIAIFLEKELINGTDDKATGALSTETTLIAGSTSDLY